MPPQQIKLLLLGDNLEDARLLQEYLGAVRDQEYFIVAVERIEDALSQLAGDGFDLVLIDLSESESEGLDKLVCARREKNDVPIIVLTGFGDEATGIKAMQAGAQDYLIKGNFDNQLLQRTIRYAIERHRLQTELERERRRKQREQEIDLLDKLSHVPQAVTAQLFGQRPLDKALPEAFGQLVERYGEIVDLALDQRGYKVEHGISERLRAHVDQLGYLKDGPRDDGELHTQ